MMRKQLSDEVYLLFRLVKMGYVKRDAPSAPRLHAKKKVRMRRLIHRVDIHSAHFEDFFYWI
jgi:hypothetical protein